MLAAHYAVPTVGNSGAVYALLVAYAMIYPNAIIYLIFFPIRAKVLIIGMIALTFLYAIHPTSQGVSWPVHLGGAATAYLLLTGTWRPKYLLEKLKLWRYNQKLKKSKSKLRVIRTHKNDDDNNRTLH